MRIFGRLSAYCLPYRRTLYASVAALALATAATMVVPYLTRALVNDVLKGHQWAAAWVFAAALPLLAAVGGLFTFAQAYGAGLFGAKCTYALREALYARLQYHGFEYYDREHTGNLMQRLTGDVEAWRMFLGQGMINGCNFVFNIVFGLVVMFNLDWQLALLSLALLPFLAMVVVRFDHRVRPVYSRIRQAMSGLQTVIQESVAGARVVKAFARESYEMEKFDRYNGSYAERNLQAGALQATFIPSIQLLGNLSAVGLLWVGGMQVIGGHASVGTVVAFFGLLGYLTGPTQQLGFLVNLYAQSAAAEQRLCEILEAPDRVRDRPGAVALSRQAARGHVRFEQVGLRYPGAAVSSLTDISLEARPGAVIALLGPTGSGKSSVVNLIPRFYECQTGRVVLDDRDVRDWTVSSLRRQVGMVPGETFLFSASILENISYGRRDATPADVERAARIADAHDFIMELPQGYETTVGERGLGLSGGQRQRIAIARAVLYDPRVLILDDATASVDMETEYEIQRALQAAMEGRTTFIIAHRLSSARRADEILVLDRGKVAERGRHAELLRAGGWYRRMYDIQFRDQAALADRAAVVRGAQACGG